MADFNIPRQNLIAQLNSGDMLTVDGDCCRNSEGIPVVKFSKQFTGQIDAMQKKNYAPKTARIRFIVYWQKEGEEKEVRIVLPELYFERVDEERQ